MVKAIVGANWGDEGKGKITDMLARQSDVVIRFHGGANAGLLAAKILAPSDPELLKRLKEYSETLKEQVMAKDARLQEVGYREYGKK